MNTSRNESSADSCTQMRRKLVTHSTLNLRTGEHADERQEWVTEPCGVPLFSDEHRARGTCRSCAAGWTHPNNYPVCGCKSCCSARELGVTELHASPIPPASSSSSGAKP